MALGAAYSGSGVGGVVLEYLHVQEIAANSSNTIQSITHTTTIDWDAVSPDSTRLDLSTPDRENAVGAIAAANTEITIAEAGRYEVIVNIAGNWDAVGNDYGQLVLNGLTGSVLDVAQNTAAAGNSDGPPVVLLWQGDLAALDTLDVRFNGSDASVSSIQSYSITVKQLPTVG